MKYRAPTRSARAPGESVLVYDDACGFCSAIARFIQCHAKHGLRLLGFSELADTGLLADLSDAEAHASAHFVTPDGLEYHGGAAMTRSLRLLPGGAVFALLDLAGLRLLRDLVYALITANRGVLSRFCQPASRH